MHEVFLRCHYIDKKIRIAFPSRFSQEAVFCTRMVCPPTISSSNPDNRSLIPGTYELASRDTFLFVIHGGRVGTPFFFFFFFFFSPEVLLPVPVRCGELTLPSPHPSPSFLVFSLYIFIYIYIYIHIIYCWRRERRGSRLFLHPDKIELCKQLRDLVGLNPFRTPLPYVGTNHSKYK